MNIKGESMIILKLKNSFYAAREISVKLLDNKIKIFINNEVINLEHNNLDKLYKYIIHHLSNDLEYKIIDITNI